MALQAERRRVRRLIGWAHERGIDITLIETMPMGEIDADRTDQYLSLAIVRRELESSGR